MASFLLADINFDIRLLYHFTVFTFSSPNGLFFLNFFIFSDLDVLVEELGVGERVDDGALGGCSLRENIRKVLIRWNP